MKKGIQYQKELSLEKLKNNDFTTIELPYGEDIVEEGIIIAGVIVKLSTLESADFDAVLDFTEKKDAEYLVIDTCEEKNAESLIQMIDSNKKKLCGKKFEIYIENGYVRGNNGDVTYSEFSDWRHLTELVKKCNNILGRQQFGICLNMGYMNLLGQNPRKMIAGTAEYLKVFHMNDNDGKRDMHQIPYSFTTGRGALSTDLYRAIGQLIAIGYEGYLIFDTTGVFRRIPLDLQDAFLDILNGLDRVWEDEFHFEDKLNQPGKKIILFGAGAMAKTYLDQWEEKYPPAFLIDNNSEIWGVVRGGYEIKSPEAILEIPEDERIVLICNMYYDAVAKQLNEMGVRYDYFWDQYYI